MKGGLLTEVDRDELQARMEKFGFTEQDARVSIYLDEAEDLLTKLEREDQREHSMGHLLWRETHVREHFRALARHLAIRVLRRDYPDGWGYKPFGDDEEEDDKG